MLEYVLMIVPVVFLVGSVCYAYKSVVKGRSRKRAVATQIASFCVVGFACLLTSLSVFAAGDGGAAATAGDVNVGVSMIAAALATGISGIGGGIAVGNAAPAAIGATSEDPKAFGKALIFVALGEGVALYGLLVSILIISKV
ncbi:MAG: ATP synthase subunit C [Acutalibacteraceae bacterium]